MLGVLEYLVNFQPCAENCERRFLILLSLLKRMELRNSQKSTDFFFNLVGIFEEYSDLLVYFLKFHGEVWYWFSFKTQALLNSSGVTEESIISSAKILLKPVFKAKINSPSSISFFNISFRLVELPSKSRLTFSGGLSSGRKSAKLYLPFPVRMEPCWRKLSLADESRGAQNRLCALPMSFLPFTVIS